MRAAIIAVTDRGAGLAEKISAKVDASVFVRGKNFERLTDLVAEIFGKFDVIVFICATGIAVRMIAPHIVSKLSDPAVIVIDELGRNAISLLSGHVGRANDWTRKISAAIGANPIITTATDIEGKISVDSFTTRLGLLPEPKAAIKAINSAILRGEEVFVTAGDTRLNLIPQKLIAGIGCRRSTPSTEIFSALQKACAEILQPIERINLIASVDIKRDEVGLIELANVLGVELKFFSVEDLAKKILEYKLEESPFVEKILGVGNVCEAAALCCVKEARFALPKRIFNGVTIALLWSKDTLT